MIQKEYLNKGSSEKIFICSIVRYIYIEENKLKGDFIKSYTVHYYYSHFAPKFCFPKTYMRYNL